jgi:hypothetical protein
MENLDDPRIGPLLAVARKEFSFEYAIRQWAIQKILAADLSLDFEALLLDQGQALDAWLKSKEGRKEALKLRSDAEEKLRKKSADATERSRAAANALHNRPGGSREKVDAIRKIWGSGKYKSKDLCAEQECASLNMSFAAARKALRNISSPLSRCTA